MKKVKTSKKKTAVKKNKPVKKAKPVKKKKVAKKSVSLKKTAAPKKTKALKKTKPVKKVKATKKAVVKKKAKALKKITPKKKQPLKKAKATKILKTPKKAKPVKKVKVAKKEPVAKVALPKTPAIQNLQNKNVIFTLHSYEYEEPGGTIQSAIKLGADEHRVIKTLVMEDENGKPLIMLMHGDREVATDALAATIGAQMVFPCTPEIAEGHTGYQVGGTSPFGIQKVIPVFMERTIAELPTIYINAGQRGLLAQMSPVELIDILKPFMVSVAI